MRGESIVRKVSKDIVRILWVKQQGHCNNIVCDVDLVFEIEKYHLDHIMPLILGGLHDDANLQLLCAKCNRRKGSKHPSEFVI
jgi:5-methylcytosine-specific restriction endonuclease McrA